ncbi:hypothetical protein [uncultured Gammaproteobacteria bacterium]|nr:hypothetical protein [uncultured Gammaproteobacteria bacterium]
MYSIFFGIIMWDFFSIEIITMACLKLASIILPKIMFFTPLLGNSVTLKI